MSEMGKYAERALEILGAREQTWWTKLRDKVGNRIANWALVNIATFEYQAAIYALVESGREQVRAQMATNADTQDSKEPQP